jgi:hypothetical protein
MKYGVRQEPVWSARRYGHPERKGINAHSTTSLRPIAESLVLLSSMSSPPGTTEAKKKVFDLPF